MGAYLNVYWVMGLTPMDGQLGIGHYVWVACVAVNFGRALYLFRKEGRPKVSIGASVAMPPPLIEKDGYIKYPRVALVKGKASPVPDRKEP